MVRYQTIVYKYWDWVDDIKEKIKEFEFFEGKKQWLRDMLIRA